MRNYKIRACYRYSIVFLMYNRGDIFNITITKANSSSYEYENIQKATSMGNIPWHYEKWMPINKIIRTADMRFKEMAGQTLLPL